MRYSVSISTIPCRIKLIEPVLNSYLQQLPPPECIYVHIPPRYLRFPNERITIPAFCETMQKVVINRTSSDWGPATKVLGAMECACIPKDMHILVSDDDCKKKAGWAQLLLEGLAHADVCSIAPTHYSKVLFGGGWGVRFHTS